MQILFFLLDQEFLGTGANFSRLKAFLAFFPVLTIGRASKQSLYPWKTRSLRQSHSVFFPGLSNLLLIAGIVIRVGN